MLKKIMAIVFALSTVALLSGCGSGSPIGPTPIPSGTPLPEPEPSIEWLGTNEGSGSVLPFNEWAVHSTVRCTAPSRYSAGYITCVAGPSVDGVTLASPAKSRILQAPFHSEIVTTEGRVSPNSGVTQTNFIVSEVHYYPNRNDINTYEVIARGAPIPWVLNFQ